MEQKQNLKVPISLYLAFLLSLISLFIVPGFLSVILTLIGISRIKKFPELFEGFFLGKINLTLSLLGIFSGGFVILLVFFTSPFIAGYFHSKFESSIASDLRQLGSAVKMYSTDNKFIPENLKVLTEVGYLNDNELEIEKYSLLKDDNSFIIRYKPSHNFRNKKYKYSYSSEKGVTTDN
ncbi:hypothetical protein KAU33_04900 [Candidatus Dependentiae bacterium]|nr:hypothetical protein [Candidatus Dependentiae bacterium]